MRSALLIGAGVWAFTWGAVLGQGTPARAHVPGGVFAATVTGAVRAQPRAQAEASGFLAAEPEAESREVTLSGWFAAEAQGLAVSSTAGDPIRLP